MEEKINQISERQKLYNLSLQEADETSYNVNDDNFKNTITNNVEEELVKEEVAKKINIYAIVDSAGMSTRPEFYSGRGVIQSYADLDQNILNSIYLALSKTSDLVADNFLKLVFSMETLGATEFLNSLYYLANNKYNYNGHTTDNIDFGHGTTEQKGIIGLCSLFKTNQSEEQALCVTNYIKNCFSRKLPQEKIDRIEEVKNYQKNSFLKSRAKIYIK